MDLLSADRELTRNSYYAATAAREQAFPPLQGSMQLRRGGGRRRAGRAVGGAGAGRARLFGHAARSAAARLGRQRPQRRPGHPRPGLRPGHHRTAARPGRCAARLGHVDRGAGPAARAHPPPWHRLRLARRLPRPGHQRAQGPRAAGLGRTHGQRLRLRAAAHRAGRDARLDRQPALPQRRLRCALGPPAPAEVHAGPGARRRRGRRDAARTVAGAGAAAGRDGAAAHAAGRAVGAPGAAGRQRLPARHRARAGAAHHAGGHLYRLQPAAGRRAGRQPDPVARGGVRHQLRARLLPHHQRPASALWRPRQLQHGDADRTWPRACASAWC